MTAPFNARVPQLVDGAASEAVGCGFESHLGHHLKHHEGTSVEANTSISFDQFEKDVNPIMEEARQLNRRLDTLRSEFLKLANKVEDDGTVDEEDFKDKVFGYALPFFDNIDYEYSNIKFGDVQIWEASSC